MSCTPTHAGSSEQKITLRHRQTQRGLAGEQLAVGVDAVGLRILTNLLGNVVKFTSRGRVTPRARNGADRH